MAEEETKDPMCFAYISCIGIAHTELTVCFVGKTVRQQFTGLNHYNRAVAAASEWNKHFATQWEMVTDTSARVTCIFVEMLRLRGVSQADIDAALRGAMAYA